MSKMTDRMSEASAQSTIERPASNPRKGEQFRCETCGMEVEVTSDCHCEDPGMVRFQCCGKQLRPV